MNLVPEPDPDATSISDLVTVMLGPQEEAAVSFKPENSDRDIALWTVAISKRPETNYEILLDDSPAWGPALAPPCDPDDKAVTWTPVERFDSELRVTVSNLRETGNSRQYHVQPLGWEVPP